MAGMATKFTFVPQATQRNDGRRRMRWRTACESCRNRKRRCDHNTRSGSALASSDDPAPPATPTDLANGDSDPKDAASPETVQATDEDNPAGPDLGNQPSTTPTSTSHLVAGDATATPQHTDSGHDSKRRRRGPRSRTRPATLLPSQRPNEPSTRTYQRPPSPTATTQDSPSTPRFVSNLNPEAHLLDKNASPDDTHESAHGIGIWVQQRASSTSKRASPDGASLSGRSRGVALPPGGLPSTNPISDIVPRDAITALSDIYFAKIHPLLPLLHEHEYRQHLTSGTMPAPLAHAVCLVAAKDNAAEPHLKLLQAGDAPVSARQFCSRLHASLVAALSGRVCLRKLTTIRVMALVSLHHEGCGSDGAEQAHGYIAQAMHRSQSLAMHLRRPDDEGFEMTRVFWCLWTLDRFMAAMHSRPCTMSDSDIAVAPITPGQSGSVAFDMLFRIARILNAVIALYRPTNPDSVTGVDADFAGFEQIVEDAKGWNLPSSVLSTLHVFYLSAAMLSHRLKTVQSLPVPTAARLRQQLSAVQTIRLLRDPRRLQSLHPFPMTVYAASLALSVSYQQLRHSRLAADQEQARHDFNAACGVLQDLRQKWASADVIASLALRISAELDKVSSLDVLLANRAPAPAPTIVPAAAAEQGEACQPREQQHLQRSGSDEGLLGGQDADPDRTLCCSENGAPRAAEWEDSSAALDLFGGMDDMSWMYLDAGNSVGFDRLPLQDFWLDEAQFGRDGS